MCIKLRKHCSVEIKKEKLNTLLEKGNNFLVDWSGWSHPEWNKIETEEGCSIIQIQQRKLGRVQPQFIPINKENVKWLKERNYIKIVD